MSERAFDIVMWGATGATGRRAAHHLARRCAECGLRLAIGGRNRQKLEAVREDLPDAGGPITLLVGDSHDTAFMAEMTARTRVVVSTVGPFALYGSALVAACAQNGTQYCDLTAEPQWMRAMIDAHDEKARETGARIVHACGHDSIPSDLGVQFLQDAALERFGKPCNRVATRVTRMKGGFSGGTAASFLNAMRLRETDPGFATLSLDPYALCPEGERNGPDGPDRMMPIEVTWDGDLQAWTKPYFMGPMNSKVVRRSNAIMGYPYGRDFRYEETEVTRGGLGGWLSAMRGTLFGWLFLKAMASPATRGFREQLARAAEHDPFLALIADSFIPLHETLCAIAEDLDDVLRAIAKERPVARRLMTVPGVGVMVSLGFIATVDHPERFSRTADVGAFLGLTPRRHQSGETDYSGRISKCGSTAMRTLLFEAAACLIRQVKRFSALKSWAVRLAGRMGFKKAAVATARKLAVILLTNWKDGTEFEWTREAAT
jgi:short subunit dehydrogenase-like uncharacterized protein